MQGGRSGGWKDEEEERAALVSSLTSTRIFTHNSDITPGKRILLSAILELMKEKEREGRGGEGMNLSCDLKTCGWPPGGWLQ